MSTQTENAVLKLVIDGKQAMATYDQLLSAKKDQLKLVRKLKEDGDASYKEQLQHLKEINAAEKARRDELYKTQESSKGFFKSFKDGFAEMAGNITAGTLVYKGVSAALGAIKDIWNGSEAAFKEAEQNQAQLSAVLKSTQGAAGLTQQALNDLATAQMNLTGIDDDAITKSEALLLTFTNVRGEIFEKSIPAILDMSKALGTDLQSSSIQVGKALNNPIAGLTALKKVGVSFTESQKEQIITLQKSGDMMGAQKIILGELTKEFGGTAQAIRNTSSGALEAFNTDLGNLQERIGKFITSGKGMFAEFFGPLVRSLADARTEGEKLTDQFNEQSKKVDGLQKNLIPLADRYDELTTKGSLNKAEQGELKTVIGQIAEILPSAVTQWDKYGNAMGVNTTKAREFADVQKALLAFQNKSAIETLIKERNQVTADRNAAFRMLNKGEITETIAGSGGTTGVGTQITQKLTDAEITGLRNQIKQKVLDQKKIDDTIKGLTGSYLDDIKKGSTTPDNTGGGMTEAEKEAAKRKAQVKAEEARKEKQAYVDGLKQLNDKLEEFNADQLALTLEANAREQYELSKKYADEIKIAKDALDKLKKNANAKESETKAVQDKIDQLTINRDKALDALKEKQYQEGLAKLKEENDKILKEEERKKKELDKINADAAEKTQADKEKAAQAAEEKKLAIKQTAIAAAENIAGAVFEIGRRSRQRETDEKLAELDKQREAELSNKNLTEAQKKKINEKYDKEQAKIKLKAWESEKDAALKEAVINGALAVVKALPNPFAAVAAGVAAAAQIAVIASEKPPQFGDGGFIPQGATHASGGMNIVGPYGQIYGNIEGGEPILSRETYANNSGVINALLNSNGKHLNYDRVMSATTNREARRSFTTATTQPRTSGASSTQGAAQTASSYSDRLDRMERLMEMQLQYNELPVVWSDKVMQEKQARNVQIKDQASV